MRMSGRWVQELFVEHGDHYEKVLESFLQRTGEEAQWIAGVLESKGVPKGSRVLDLACGIGRHSVELAQHGYHVTGVDLSEVYVARAKALAAERGLEDRIEFLACDMRYLAPCMESREYDAIVNLFTSFGYYDDETNETILAQCRKHSREGAIFLIDVMNRDWLVENFEPRSFRRVEDRLFLEERSIDLPRGRMKNQWTILQAAEDGDYRTEATIDLDHRIYTLHELVWLFDQTDWRFEEAYGSLTGAPFAMGARRIAAVFSGR